jgi:hypothetical protein
VHRGTVVVDPGPGPVPCGPSRAGNTSGTCPRGNERASGTTSGGSAAWRRSGSAGRSCRGVQPPRCQGVQQGEVAWSGDGKYIFSLAQERSGTAYLVVTPAAGQAAAALTISATPAKASGTVTAVTTADLSCLASSGAIRFVTPTALSARLVGASKVTKGVAQGHVPHPRQGCRRLGRRCLARRGVAVLRRRLSRR